MNKREHDDGCGRYSASSKKYRENKKKVNEEIAEGLHQSIEKIKMLEQGRFELQTRIYQQEVCFPARYIVRNY